MARPPHHRPAGRGLPVRVPSARVALSTSSVYPESCADAFEIAARLGYDGVELMVWTDPVSQDPRALARLAAHYALPVLAVHAPTLLVTQRVWSPDPWQRLRRALRSVDGRAVHGLHRALPLHHRHAARGPAEDEVGVEPLPRHRVVAGAGGVVHGEHDLRHARRRDSGQQPAARTSPPRRRHCHRRTFGSCR